MVLKPDYQIDMNWLHTISHDLDRFKSTSVSGKTFIARCPYCGDSQKSKRKARLYFYTKSQSLNFDCKNCGAHGSFWTFMYDQFPQHFDQYKKEQMLKRLETGSKTYKRKTYSTTKPVQRKQESAGETKALKGCISLSEVSNDHPAVQYLVDRGFERDMIDRLLYAEDFYVTAESINHEPLSPNFPSEPRIVIPFYSINGDIEMIQGRSLDQNSKLRYISIKTHEDVDKIFGKDHVDRDRTVYCVEGPLDSLFVDNCIATCDSSLMRSDADVLIWDNEPMNEDICNNIRLAIDNNRSVVIWPNSPLKKQDINDMIRMGITSDLLMGVIRSCTFKGLKALAKFNQWKRV